MADLSPTQRAVLRAVAHLRHHRHSWDTWDHEVIPCSWLAAEALAAWGVSEDARRRRAPDLALYDQDRSPWSPVYAAAELVGLTRAHGVLLHHEGPHRPEPGRVCYAQGWRELWRRGHTWLWLAHPDQPWQGWVLESGLRHGTQVRAHRVVDLADAIDEDGEPTSAWPMPWPWSAVVHDYLRGDGLAYVELPDLEA